MTSQPDPTPLTAHHILSQVLDPGTFTSWDEPVAYPEQPKDYAASLRRAADHSGVDESIITGTGRLHGTHVAVVAGDFTFLAGSLGIAAADRLTAAITRATAARLPLLAACASGGTRMQEGTPAFVRMMSITAALVDHKTQGLPYLVYLGHPTTGGVLASWGSLGHITVAQPGALVGFLGPRVYQALYGEPFPPGVQTAENLAAHGLIDAVLPPEDLPEALHRCLRILTIPPTPPTPLPDDATSTGSTDAWASITASRNPNRPGVRRFLRTLGADVVALNGTGEGETDPGLLLALVRSGGQSYVLLGQDRTLQTAHEPLGPGALRQARRGMRLAHELHLPLVTYIDTPGAALSQTAEEGGLAGEIARCLAGLIKVPVPTVSVIAGPGTGGGALALLPADVVLCAHHGWLSPLPPEGASVIVHRTPDHAADMARHQRVASADLLTCGTVDRVIAEHPDAATEPDEFCRRLGHHIATAVHTARSLPLATRTTRRGRHTPQTRHNA